MLEALENYPIIPYHQGFTGRARIDRVFAEAVLEPDIVMAALDADVIKAYVELGLGVWVVASMAIDPEHDHGLKVAQGASLFGKHSSRIAIRQGYYLHSYAYDLYVTCFYLFSMKYKSNIQ